MSLLYKLYQNHDILFWKGQFSDQKKRRGWIHIDYEQPLFFLSPSRKTCERRKWPRAWLKARDGRGTRAAHRSRTRALLSLNLKKKRDCSQSRIHKATLHFCVEYVTFINVWTCLSRSVFCCSTFWCSLSFISTSCLNFSSSTNCSLAKASSWTKQKENIFPLPY